MSRSAYTLVRENVHFRNVWLGQVCSQAGLRMYQIAIMWWLLTKVSQDLGGQTSALFMLFMALPGIILLKQIGQIIDRSPSRRIIVTSSIVSTLLLVGIFLFLTLRLTGAVPAIFLLGFLIALAQAFINPTLTKSVSELVDPDDVAVAVAFETSTQSLANFSGAMFGALLIDKLGVHGVIMLTACCYLLSAIVTARAVFRPIVPPAATETSEVGRGMWDYLKSHPILRFLLFTFSAANFFANPIFVILPVYTMFVLKGSATQLGQLEGALWIGLLIGAFGQRLVARFKNILLIGALALLGIGILLSLPGFLVSMKLYLGALFFVGIFLGITNVLFVAYFQKEVSDAVKGRFFALMQGILSFTFPGAYFLFGFLVDHIGAKTTCLLQGGGMILVGGFLLLNRNKGEKKIQEPLGTQSISMP